MKNLKITVNGTAYDVQVEETGASAPVASAPTPVAPKAAEPAPTVAVPVAPKASAPAPAADAEVISSPMPGTIVSVEVKPGQTVKKSDVLVVLEAMKMENEIMAPHDAVVAAVHVNKGDSVNSGTALISLK